MAERRTVGHSPCFARPAAVLTILFFVLLPAVTARIYASDEIEFFAFLRSLWFDRDVSFENEYQYFYDAGIAASPGFHETFLERRTETGNRINFGTIGPAILWAPFYALADLFVLAVGDRAGLPRDGYAKPYVAAVAFGSAIYGFLALLLSMRIAGRIVTGSPASSWAESLAAVAIWFGTPLFFYMYVAPPMSHAPSAFAVSLFLCVWLHVRERWSVRGCLALGLAAGLMAMVREQDLFFVAGPLLDYVVTWIKVARRSDGVAPSGRPIALAAASALTFILAYMPQLAAYVALNGHIGPSRLVARKMTWTAPHAVQVLLSPAHGFFFWTPLAGLALVGLVWLAVGTWPHTIAAGESPVHRGRATKQIGVCMLVMFAAQVYVAGSVESWTVAGAFGQRRFVALTPLLVVGIAVLIERCKPRGVKVVALALILISVWWNIGLTVQFGSGMMNRQRLELGRIAYNNFITVPRMLPELAYRYIVDRQSFYGTRRD